MQSAESKNSSTLDNLERLFAQQELGSRWGADPVVLAIAAEKEERNQQGKPFNCFVITRPTANRTEKNDEFVDFVADLKANIDQNKFLETTRFQIAVYDQSKKHWTAFDFLIKDKKLNVLCFDAANDSSADSSLEMIREKFPDCNAVRLEPDPLSGVSAGRFRQIQNDNWSCSRMTLEHLFLLSESHLLEKLNFSKLPTEPGSTVKLISPKEVLELEPSLLRTTQSLSVVESFGRAKRLSASAVGHTLGEYVAEHTEIVETKKSNGEIETKRQNKAIEHSKDAFIKKIREFCKAHGEEGIQDTLKKRNSSWKNFINMSASERAAYISTQTTSTPFHTNLTNALDRFIENNDKIIAREEQRINEVKKKINENHKQVNIPHYANFLMMSEETIKSRKQFHAEVMDLKNQLSSNSLGGTLDEQKQYIQMLLDKTNSSELKKTILEIASPYLNIPSEVKQTSGPRGNIISLSNLETPPMQRSSQPKDVKPQHVVRMHPRKKHPSNDSKDSKQTENQVVQTNFRLR